MDSRVIWVSLMALICSLTQYTKHHFYSIKLNALINLLDSKSNQNQVHHTSPAVRPSSRHMFKGSQIVKVEI